MQCFCRCHYVRCDHDWKRSCYRLNTVTQKLLHPRLWLNEHVLCSNHILSNCGASSGGGIGGCCRGKQQDTMYILYVETTNHWLCSNVLTTKEASPTGSAATSSWQRWEITPLLGTCEQQAVDYNARLQPRMTDATYQVSMSSMRIWLCDTWCWRRAHGVDNARKRPSEFKNHFPLLLWS